MFYLSIFYLSSSLTLTLASIPIPIPTPIPTVEIICAQEELRIFCEALIFVGLAEVLNKGIPFPGPLRRRKLTDKDKEGERELPQSGTLFGQQQQQQQPQHLSNEVLVGAGSIPLDRTC